MTSFVVGNIKCERLQNYFCHELRQEATARTQS